MLLHIPHTRSRLLVKNQTAVGQPAPYSPDMAPCDFWLFLKIKRSLKGARLQTREEIMAETTAELNSIPKEAFLECFQQWQHRCEKCVEFQGDYFEAD